MRVRQRVARVHLRQLIVVGNTTVCVRACVRVCVCVCECRSRRCPLRAAAAQPQRVVPVLLHLVPAARRLLRAQHVRRRRHRELSQVSREPGAGGESASWGPPRPQTRPETQTYDRPPAVISPSLVVYWLVRWTRDSRGRAVESRLFRCQVTTLGKLFTHVPLSPSSIIWYRSRGDDATKNNVTLQRVSPIDSRKRNFFILWPWTLKYDVNFRIWLMIQYDTRCYLNVRSKYTARNQKLKNGKRKKWKEKYLRSNWTSQHARYLCHRSFLVQKLLSRHVDWHTHIHSNT